jgi:hypothetical protein
MNTPMRLLLIVVFLFTGLAYASAWGRPQGQWFLSTTYYQYRGTRYADNRGIVRDGTLYAKDSAIGYAEYGLDPTSTLLLKLPYERIRVGDFTKEQLTETEIGLIKRISPDGSPCLAWQIKETSLGPELGFLIGHSFAAGFWEAALLANGIKPGFLVTTGYALAAQHQILWTLEQTTAYSLMQTSLSWRYIVNKNYSLTLGHYWPLTGVKTGLGEQSALGVWAEF